MKSLRKINCFFSCLSETFCKFLKALKLQRSKTNKQTKNTRTKFSSKEFVNSVCQRYAREGRYQLLVVLKIWVYQYLHDATKALPRKIHPTYHHVVILR